MKDTHEDQKGVDVLVKAIREVPVMAYKVILDRFPACQTQSLVDLQMQKSASERRADCKQCYMAGQMSDTLLWFGGNCAL